MANQKLKKEKGFTLIETLVGIFLILVVFLGILSAYQLSLKVIELSKNKITALAIANQEIEKIRDLPYGLVGIDGGTLPAPQGILSSSDSATRNNVEYTIEREIKYMIDGADGINESGGCDWDYKRAKIKVSWNGLLGQGEANLTTDIMPKNQVEEISACTAQPGGILAVEVFDAYGLWENRGAPLIEVFDPTTSQIVDSFEPNDGKHNFPLPASDYRVAVSKTGYSSERTFSIGEIAAPEKPNPLVLEGEISELSFSIDKVGAFSVKTLSPWGLGYFSDSFSDQTKISEIFDISVNAGEAVLAQNKISGYLISSDIIAENLINWQEFSFNDFEPSDAQIKYHILYFNGADWILIPDSDLAGNSLGFAVSPLDLSGLDVGTYPQIRVKADFSSAVPGISPVLYDWLVSWKNSQAFPIANAPFHLRGEKNIGKDENENIVYKYSQDHISNGSGLVDISNLEWDSYTFSVQQGASLDIESIEPSQPVALSPDETKIVNLYLKAQNSLLVNVQDVDLGKPVFSAEVRLYNLDLGYDETQYADENGETYFIPLEAGNYTLEVQGQGYSGYSGNISVLGDLAKIINLTEIE